MGNLDSRMPVAMKTVVVASHHDGGLTAGACTQSSRSGAESQSYSIMKTLLRNNSGTQESYLDP